MFGDYLTIIPKVFPESDGNTWIYPGTAGLLTLISFQVVGLIPVEFQLISAINSGKKISPFFALNLRVATTNSCWLIAPSEFASAASILAYLCTCKNALPQGGITSPSLSNLICGKLDKRLSSYTSRRNIVYTRYADDMTFSSNNPKKLQRAYPMLIKIITTSNFQINDDKVRFFGPRRKCLITGLVKNSTETSFGIGRKKKRMMRAVMHNLLVKGGTDAKYNNVLSTNGWLSYLKSVDTDSYKQMKAYYNKLKTKQKRNKLRG